MQECRDESEIYNYQQIQLLNNKFINVILGVMLDLTVTHYKGKIKFQPTIKMSHNAYSRVNIIQNLGSPTKRTAFQEQQNETTGT